MNKLDDLLEYIQNKNKVIIFGEDHSSKERTIIENKIRKIRPDYLLSEELGPHRYFTGKEIRKGLKLNRYSNSDRTFKLGLELNIPVIGIDLWHNLPNNLKEQFKIRENHMVKVINSFKDKGLICVIVGDTHLRTIRTKELGKPSPLNDIKNATIYRSGNKEIY